MYRPFPVRVPPIARPSEARPKSAMPPPISECRKMSATDECPPVRRPSDVRCLSVCRPLSVRRGIVRLPPVVRPCAVRKKSVRRPHHVKCPTVASPCRVCVHSRTQNELLTNTHAPARQAALERTMPVERPPASPFHVRYKPVSCPWPVR